MKRERDETYSYEATVTTGMMLHKDKRPRKPTATLNLPRVISQGGPLLSEHNAVIESHKFPAMIHKNK